MTRADARPSATIGLLSTYPPTQCGLATFSAALVAALPNGSVDVVRVLDGPQPADVETVAGHLVNGSSASALAAVGHLNGTDVVLLQHEYGIFGGTDGEDVLTLVDALTVPLVVVFHTVLSQPRPNQERILRHLIRACDVAVTMTETARQRLINRYDASPAVVTLIPHGAPDHRALQAARTATQPARTATQAARPARTAAQAAQPARTAAQVTTNGASVRPASPARPLVLTWGLLGPGKGIEVAIEAMAGLRDLNPCYLVMGKTHPKVVERHGETYRASLLGRIVDSGVGDLVELDPSYLDVEELARLIETADVVLLPYDSREQVTSGVLIEAVAAGRPVVSTAFPHAVELLTGGAGLVVPQGDAPALEAALRRVLSEPGLAAGMAAHARRIAPDLMWGAVADRYRGIADKLKARRLMAA